ncbi:PH domain-containing protein [Corynebacterium sp. TAE3-ERU30]|nr:PH domain-containing protein [Corynebacterium sp. TAE3-ERU30]
MKEELHPDAAAPDNGAAAVTADNAEFQRVHPLTPLIRFWRALLALIVAIGINQRELLGDIVGLLRDRDSFSLLPIVVSIGGTVLVLGLTWALSRIWWKRNGYRLGSDEVVVEKGVFSRQSRSARCDRIQAVDVAEPLVARICGLAAVHIETAGGDDSVLKIEYLDKNTAEQVKDTVLRHSRGEQDAPRGAATESAAAEWPVTEHSAPAAPAAAAPELLAAVPVRQALLALALQWSTIVTALALILIVLTPAGLAIVLPMLLAGLPSVVSFANRAWGFRAEHNATTHELLLRYGLTERRSQTVPLHRVHGVSITQPLLWRRIGWWKVTVSVAGYGDSSDTSTTTTVLPVGDYATATALLLLLSKVDAEHLQGPAQPGQLHSPMLRSPRQARWLGPVHYRYRGLSLVEDYAVIHTGRFSRTMSVVELEHIQELTLSAGPLQQYLGLVSVRLDLVEGPVKMELKHIASADGYALLNRLRQRQLPALHSPDSPAAATPHRPPQPPHWTDSSISAPPASESAPER